MLIYFLSFNISFRQIFLNKTITKHTGEMKSHTRNNKRVKVFARHYTFRSTHTSILGVSRARRQNPVEERKSSLGRTRRSSRGGRRMHEDDRLARGIPAGRAGRIAGRVIREARVH